MKLRHIPAAVIAAALAMTTHAGAAELTTKQVIEALRDAAPGALVDLSGKDLSDIDLSELDFSHADLSYANLFAADLTGADFSGTNLSHANLTRAIIIRANFTGANLSNASLYRPVTFSSEDAAPSETPILAGANFSGARLIVHL